jgi:hypothetical protein
MPEPRHLTGERVELAGQAGELPGLRHSSLAWAAWMRETADDEGCALQRCQPFTERPP